MTADRPVGVTRTQAMVLRFVVDFVEEQGFSPTLAEIADGLAMSKRGAQVAVDALVQRRRLTRERGLPRSLMPV